MSSYFTLLHSRSTNTLSNARPRPSMLTATPADSSARERRRRELHPLVGVEDLRLPPLKASSSISRQNVPSSVFDNLQAIT